MAAVLQASDKCSHTQYAALSRSACALPLNLIRGFRTTSSKFYKKQAGADPRLVFLTFKIWGQIADNKLMGPIDSRPVHLIPVFMVVPLVSGITKNSGNPSEAAG